MKRSLFCIIASLSLCLSAVAADPASSLPKVNIAGSEYYLYEVKKGDSTYGIANRFGWNIDRLSKLNPSVGPKLEKDMKIYYPVREEDADIVQDAQFTHLEAYPVIRHIVKKGDSVYSIAKMYGVPLDLIYQYNPSAKTFLKRGDVITIPQDASAINNGSGFLYYTVKDGDTLSAIANNYNTSIEQLLRDNKGITENNFASGALLRVKVNSNKDHMVTRQVDETRVARIDSYTADKNDTWDILADRTGVDVKQLLEANSGTQLKKNAHIAVPVIETTTVEKEVSRHDDREESLEGRRDIYKEVHMIGASDSDSGDSDVVSITLVIEDPSSKRDNEFTRGALLALDKLKDSPYNIRMQVICDNRTPADSVKVTDGLRSALDEFKPDIVIATYEKNFPLWLSSYGETNGVEIVNSFDVKNELYLDNPSMIHLLTPSTYFSDEVGEWTASSLGRYELIMVGKADLEDAFAEAVKNKVVNTSKITRCQLDELSDLSLPEEGKFLFYGYPTSKEDIQSMLSAIESLKEKYPFADIKVLGRPSWITVAESLKDKFHKADVYFPSRFYFDHSSSDGKEFIANYSASYGHGPIRSYPTYAVAGYDILNYFIPGLASNNGDFNSWIPESKEIQTPINLERVGNWGGLYNPSSYIIRYSPYGDIEKILLRK